MKKIGPKFCQCHIVLVFITFLSFNFVRAQEKLDLPIPVDTQVKTGKLENGLTYYIRKNSKPEKRVEMRFVVKAGSVLEEDDQQGLAHFVEHMAFNGTKNFAKNDLVHYMQSVGVQFGPEVNAETGINHTLYMLTLPTDSAHIVEKGFQIMEDWAHNITFDGTEIDKERGVIMEEWRMNQGMNLRFINKLYPALFEGSQYAQRIPLGKKEVIEGAPHERIRQFYRDWYRPDLMAFVVVGDIDPDAIEKSIKAHFGSIKNPENSRPRKNYPVPGHAGTRPMVMTDKEMPLLQVMMFCMIEPEKETLQKDYRRSLVNVLVSGMLTQRFNELKDKPDPALLGAQVEFAPIVPEKDIFLIGAVAPETGTERAVQTLVVESERAVRHGFTEGELNRQKREVLTAYENAYNERDKTNSVNYASEYLRNFLNDEPIPGIEFEYGFAKEYVEGITLEEVNQALVKLLPADNRLMVVLAPEKEGLQLPGEEQILSYVDLAMKSEIAPYEDKISGSQLLAEKPAKGRILLAKKNEALGTFEMKLSNGARVVLKATDFKNDQVLFSAYSPGGYSVYETVDHQAATFSNDIVSESGVAAYSTSDVSKLLAGKNVSVSPYIDAYYEGISGSSTPRDMESMFQLAYLYFTSPRKDSALFKSIMDLQKGYVKNALTSPETYFSDQFVRARTQNHPRADVLPTENELDQVKLERLYEIYNDRFADASDFTFFIVGAIKMDSIRPFIEQYLASLPSTRRQESWKDMGIRPPAEKLDKAVYKGNDPKSMVGIYFESNQPWDLREDHALESLGQLLGIRYIDVIREEMSGAYHVGAYADLGKIPYSRAILNIVIPCSPDNTDKLTQTALDEIAGIQKNGVKPEDLVKVKEAQRRDLERNMKENSFWISELANGYRNEDPALITRYADWINNLTSEEIQAAANKFDLKNYVRVVLYPEKN
ncbi:MAG: insulinase family protein [Bacteroidales bacterium]|nr:insulinase family protein [Bacteroidales bacterium]